MGEFFKPLRRKIGVAMLLMGCAFTAGWVRSLHTRDFLTLVVNKRSLSVRSDSGMTECMVRQYMTETPPPLFWNERTSWNSTAVSEPNVIGSIEPGPVPLDLFNSNKHELLGFVFQSGGLQSLVQTNEQTDLIKRASLAFPDSVVVIPLMLLSAWLLLKKPKGQHE